MYLMSCALRVTKPLLNSARSMSSKSKVVAPLANRFFLFNYFEKQKIDEPAFVEHWTEVADYVKLQKHFISTHLHQAICEKTRFQWVNFAVFDSDDICVFGKPDPNWGKLMKGGSDIGLAAFPGKYQEIASYRGNPLNTENKERPDESRFLVTGIVAEESVSDESIEENWASWSGTEYLQEHSDLKDSVGDSLFYKFLFGPKRLVRYTVRTELTGVDEEKGNAIAELMEKQDRPNDVHAHTGLYKVRTNLFYEGNE